MARTYCLNNAAPPKEQQQETLGESGSNSDLPTSLAAPALQSYPSQLAFVATTNYQVPMAPPAPLDRAAPPAVSAPQATPSQPVIHLALPPLLDYAESGSNSLLLMGLEEVNQLKTDLDYPQDHRISPSESQSRAMLVALESNRSTPVPRPVENPHERSAQGQRNVHRPVTLHSSSPTGPRDFSRRQDASPRLVDPLGSTRQPRPVSPRRLEPSATSLQTRHIGRRETSLHVPGAYGSPRTSCASGASTATPSSVAAVAASAATTSATRASHNGSSHSPQLPARPGDSHCSSSERPECNKTAIAPSNYGCGESSFRVPASYASPQHSCPSGDAIVAPATGMAATNANCSFVEETVALPGSAFLPTKG
ncbi:hypothetical protein PCANC_20361 [Puccinia coronata f. sp. avenae]|uniref:Uncharacterized protein n=1 Tax=Puccinia coronata f. sp. avenae TaxID=200324 RepID=A0A2N5U1N3_9BASI|nr:hypothetical protein PCANC_20361 [Puccinia coronata f. sp. avenae]